MIYPDKFNVLLNLLIEKGIITMEEYQEYFKKKVRELDELEKRREIYS